MFNCNEYPAILRKMSRNTVGKSAVAAAPRDEKYLAPV